MFKRLMLAIKFMFTNDINWIFRDERYKKIRLAMEDDVARENREYNLLLLKEKDDEVSAKIQWGISDSFTDLFKINSLKEVGEYLIARIDKRIDLYKSINRDIESIQWDDLQKKPNYDDYIKELEEQKLKIKYDTELLR